MDFSVLTAGRFGSLLIGIIVGIVGGAIGQVLWLLIPIFTTIWGTIVAGPLGFIAGIFGGAFLSWGLSPLYGVFAYIFAFFVWLMIRVNVRPTWYWVGVLIPTFFFPLIMSALAFILLHLRW
jgi:hypothetical protein